MDKFRVFYLNPNKMLFAYLMRMTGDYFLAGDIMQESLTRCLERYGQKAPYTELLFTIARDALFDHTRRQQ